MQPVPPDLIECGPWGAWTSRVRTQGRPMATAVSINVFPLPQILSGRLLNHSCLAAAPERLDRSRANQAHPRTWWGLCLLNHSCLSGSWSRDGMGFTFSMLIEEWCLIASFALLCISRSRSMKMEWGLAGLRRLRYCAVLNRLWNWREVSLPCRKQKSNVLW